MTTMSAPAIAPGGTDAAHQHEQSEVKALLQRIGDGWIKRAKVRRDAIDLTFDPARPDFLEELLPFHAHPLYQRLAPELKSKILSAGWIIYNEKTVAIESAIVSPSCYDALDGRIPGLTDETSRQIVCETLVDEAYHLLLVANANRLTRAHRGLDDLKIPGFNLVTMMNREKALQSEDWQKILVHLATSVVSEIFVSDYLHQLSDCTEIQPMNMATVAAHRHDELAHSKIFTLMTKTFYPALSPREQAFFASVLPKPIEWFADLELDIWSSVLEQLRVPGAATIVADCRPLNAAARERLDYTGIVGLSHEVGILSTDAGRNSFTAMGIAI
ncbi:diiron oxygenase [Tistrella mobilis]|uniref:AurF N-oxygenase family protein n=1 Tax=Tistrella mobilis TaxID=171437 RepID=UPI0035571D0D